jgi:acetoin utilization deacetylase AcuC-like enzyme
MVELLLGGEADVGFSAHRPPGHHALPARAMGFCLFANVAIAARFALDHCGCERVMVIDWDVHHGNGTNDIFRSTEQVLFVSIHQSPLYPGTGPATDVGSGAGEGYTVNLPVPPGSGDETFPSLIEHLAVPLAEAYAPQLILISAGYDAHREETLADCQVSDEGFARMARSLRAVASAVAVPVGCVLEGGYAQPALARSVALTMQELLVAGPIDHAEIPVSPLARAARQRAAAWWPTLSV